MKLVAKKHEFVFYYKFSITAIYDCNLEIGEIMVKSEIKIGLKIANEIVIKRKRDPIKNLMPSHF